MKKGDKIISFTAALAGNPNCGKTTLFNVCTGARLKTGNRPGVTVSVESGEYRAAGIRAVLYDLPGIYGLSSRSAEERTAQDFLCKASVTSDVRRDGNGKIPADVIINVVDATSPERSLYLTLRLKSLGIPVVTALNMTDVLEKRGGKIDTAKLSRALGIPVVNICARRGQGIKELMETAAREAAKTSAQNNGTGTDAQSDAAKTAEHKAISVTGKTKVTGHAAVHTYSSFDTASRGTFTQGVAARETRAYASAGGHSGAGRADDAAVFAEAKSICRRCISRESAPPRFTDRADSLLCRPLTGFLFLILIMAAVLFITFGAGNYLRCGLDGIFSFIICRAESAACRFPSWARELICSAVLPAVGAVVSFLPQLFILYLCLAVLDDSGYLPRAAFVADAAMSKLSLSGKAVIPLLLGYGCSVPAILASQTVEGSSAQKRLALAIPFIPCSARLPVCVMLSGMFFPYHQAAVCAVLYAVGTAVSLLTLRLCAALRRSCSKAVPLCRHASENANFGSQGRITAPSARNFGIRRNYGNEDNTLFCGCSRDRYTVPPSGAVKTGRCIFGNCSSCVSFEAEHGYTPLVMELPDFRAPGIKSVVSAAAHRSGEYLKKAGTLIFLSSAVLYFLISFGAGGAAASPAESFGAFSGKLLAPLLKPCGLGFWQIALALICAVGAKEMAVSSLAVLYGAASAPALRAILSANGFTAASAVSFLVFAVLYTPCISTLAAIRAQYGGKYALRGAFFSLAAAYVFAMVSYWAAVALGLG